MLPSLFKIQWGDLVLHLGGYGFPALCGVLAGLAPALRRAREAGLPRRTFLGVVLLALIGGLAGAKFAAWLQTGAWSGRVLYGGLLGGLATLWVAARALRVPAVATADALAPPALLAAAFGRLGCLFGGCCYGAPAALGVVYPRGSLPWRAHVHEGLLPAAACDSLPTLPMPLFEAAALLVIAVATSRLRRVGSGHVLAVAGLLYSGWRFLAEFGRGDHAPYAGTHLTFSQWISLAVFIAALHGLRTPRRSPAASPRREEFRLGAAMQILAVLLMAAIGSGSIGCSSAKREEIQDKRKEIHGRVRDKAKAYYRKAKEEFKEDCADDCARICCEITCAMVCDDDDEEDVDEDPLDLPSESPAASSSFELPVIRPGERVEAELDLRGRLNFRTDYALRLLAVVHALPHEPEAVTYRLTFKTLELSLGDLRCTGGPGEVELRLDAAGIVSLGTCTLGDEVLGVLKAVEALAPGLVRLPSTLAPAAAWREALERELASGDQVHGDATLAWNGVKRSVGLRAWIIDRGDGTRRVRWLVR